ncbi:MAG: dephospho-CoA kinase [spirochete symbiont of Stewartia floridana]|nr:MAG: dephospho-CoA kinase [spirochete symbiont of Stewartia floridana]
MPLILGIAGKMGAGKNLIASILEERGWRTLDLDSLAHQILDQNAVVIESEFGSEVIDAEGKINRRSLGAKVFNCPPLLRKLESITYPLIERETLGWLAADTSVSVAIHAINLHKTALPQRCDAILWVHASRRQRRKRVMARDGRPWNEIKARFKSQNKLKPKLFSPYAETYSIKNSGNLGRTRHRLEEILCHIEG